jgi:hypothetical protein
MPGANTPSCLRVSGDGMYLHVVCPPLAYRIVVDPVMRQFCTLASARHCTAPAHSPPSLPKVRWHLSHAAHTLGIISADVVALPGGVDAKNCRLAPKAQLRIAERHVVAVTEHFLTVCAVDIATAFACHYKLLRCQVFQMLLRILVLHHLLRHRRS